MQLCVKLFFIYFLPPIIRITAADDNFGNSVAMSGNFAFVGASNDDVGANINQGSFSIYQFNGSNWVFITKITDVTGSAVAGEIFGGSVSISGNFAAVSAFGATASAGNEPGAVFIFRFNGSNWSLMQKLTHPANGSTGINFGATVSISGNYLLVGNPFQGPNAGGLVVLVARIGLIWQELQNITDPHGSTNNDLFGISVAIDGTTNRFLIGASGFASSSGKVVFGKF